jgi:hypothetical protein
MRRCFYKVIGVPHTFYCFSFSVLPTHIEQMKGFFFVFSSMLFPSNPTLYGLEYC